MHDAPRSLPAHALRPFLAKHAQLHISLCMVKPRCKLDHMPSISHFRVPPFNVLVWETYRKWWNTTVGIPPIGTNAIILGHPEDHGIDAIGQLRSLAGLSVCSPAYAHRLSSAATTMTMTMTMAVVVGWHTVRLVHSLTDP